MTVVSQPSICRCYDIMMCYVGFTECVFPPVFWQWGTLYPLMVKSSTQAWPRHIVNHPHWHKRPAGLATWFHIQGLLYVGHVYNQEKNIYFTWSDPHHDMLKQPSWHHPRCVSVRQGLLLIKHVPFTVAIFNGSSKLQFNMNLKNLIPKKEEKSPLWN